MKTDAFHLVAATELRYDLLLALIPDLNLADPISDRPAGPFPPIISLLDLGFRV